MEELIEQISSYPPMQRNLALAIAMFVLLTVYWFFLFSPLQQSISEKKQKLKKARESVSIEKVEEKKKRLEDKFTSLERRLSLVREQFPDKAEIPRLVESIHASASSAKLEVGTFKRKEEQKQGDYATIPIEMELMGNYSQFAKFLDRVSQMERIVNVRNLEIERLGQGDLQNEELKIKARAITYRSLKKGGG